MDTGSDIAPGTGGRDGGGLPDAPVTADGPRDGGVDGRSDGAGGGGGDTAGETGTARVDAAIDATTAACASCSSWGAPLAMAPNPSLLPELSGLAASHLHPGLFYAHNDSGDSARFFAINDQAQVNAEFHLSGATATDWEDISVGPCPAGSCVYIGDTGDNKLERAEYVIHRVAEPATLAADAGVVSVASYESFRFVYPEGIQHNAETLLVHPITGQVFVVIKETGVLPTVYEMPLPLQPDELVTLTMVTSLVIPPAEGIVTDGSFHPCGDRLLIRTTGTTGLFELTRSPGQSMTTLFGGSPVRVPVAVEAQGEAVTYSLDGHSYFTSSETVSGEPAPWLSRVTCQAP